MLKYIFKDGDEVIYKGNCNFAKKDKKIQFFCGDDKITIEIKESEFSFSKENDESIFKIINTKKGNFAKLFLIDKKINFDINVLFLEVLNDNNYICFKYILESDEKSLKTLEIRY